MILSNLEGVIGVLRGKVNNTVRLSVWLTLNDETHAWFYCRAWVFFVLITGSGHGSNVSYKEPAPGIHNNHIHISWRLVIYGRK